MPLKPGVRSETEKVINIVGNGAYPLLLSLSLPVFLYSIVLEKEQRLLENMKINGLNMRNYWTVTYVFSFILYLATVFVYAGFGRYISGLSFFIETNIYILGLTLVGWGLCQVSLAFFFSVFLQDS